MGYLEETIESVKTGTGNAHPTPQKMAEEEVTTAKFIAHAFKVGKVHTVPADIDARVVEYRIAFAFGASLERNRVAGWLEALAIRAAQGGAPVRARVLAELAKELVDSDPEPGG